MALLLFIAFWISWVAIGVLLTFLSSRVLSAAPLLTKPVLYLFGIGFSATPGLLSVAYWKWRRKRHFLPRGKTGIKYFVWAFLIMTVFGYFSLLIRDYLFGPDISMGTADRDVLLSFIVMVLIGPLAEECFYRGVILDYLGSQRPWSFALGFQATLFGLSHTLTAKTLEEVAFSFMVAFLVGLILGFFYLRSGSIRVCWLGHGLQNFYTWLGT
jgi:membrane protease YdiL (CAAX protease family)